MGVFADMRGPRPAAEQRTSDTAIPYLGPFGRPLGGALDIIARPAYAVGNLLEGEVSEAARALNPFQSNIRRRGGGDVLAEALFRGQPESLPGIGRRRGTVRFVLNMLTDPLLFAGPLSLTSKGATVARTGKLGATLAEQAGRGERVLLGAGIPFTGRTATVIKGEPVLRAMTKVGAPVKAAATKIAERFSPELRLFKTVGPSGRTAREVIEEVEPRVKAEAGEFMDRLRQQAQTVKAAVGEDYAKEAREILDAIETPQLVTGQAGLRPVIDPGAATVAIQRELAEQMGGDIEAVKALQKILSMREEARDALRAAKTPESQKAAATSLTMAGDELVDFLKTNIKIHTKAKGAIEREAVKAAGPQRAERIVALSRQLEPYRKAMRTLEKLQKGPVSGAEWGRFLTLLRTGVIRGRVERVPFEEITKQIGRGRVALTPVGEDAAKQLSAILKDLATEAQALGLVNPDDTRLARAVKAGLYHEYVPHMIPKITKGPRGGPEGLAQGLKGEPVRGKVGPLAQVEKTTAEAAAARGETEIAPFTHDPFQATAIKGAEFFGKKMKIEQVRALLDEFGVPVAPGADIPEGFRTLARTPENAAVLKAIGGDRALPSEIATHVEKAYRIIVDPFGLEAPERWAWWKGFMDWWRQTSLAFPATRMRDAFSNEVQLLQMGVRPDLGLMEEATVAAWNTGNPALLTGRTWRGRTLKEWVDSASAHSVIDQYEGSMDLARAFAQGAFEMEPTAWAKFMAQLRQTPLKQALNPLSREGATAQASRAAATFLDNRARLIAFMDLVGGKGARPLNAVKLIDQVFPTARKLTSFERENITPLTSFYTWQRTNLPHQIRQLIQNPGQFAAINKLDAAIREEQDKKLPWELLPTGLREAVPLSMGRTEEGLHKFWALQAYLPQSEITKWVAEKPNIREMVLSTPWHVFRRALLEAAPPVRQFGEIAFQRDLYRDLPYQELPDRVPFMGHRVPRQVAAVLSNIRLFSTMDRAGKALFPVGAVHPEPGREPETLLELVGREAIGLPKTKTVNPRKARVEFGKSIDREIRERQGAIKRQARYPGTEAEKERLRAEIRELFSQKRRVLESSR